MACPHLSAGPDRVGACTRSATTSVLPAAARRPRPLGRRTALLLAAAVAVGLTVLPGTASAAPDTPAPQATSSQDATQRVTEANHQLEVVTEEVNDATVELHEQQAASAAAAEAVAAAQAQLAALDEQMRRVARSAFTGENLSRFGALMTSGSADEFLAQVNTLDALAGHTDAILTQVSEASRAAEDAKTTADEAAVAAQRTLDDVTARHAGLQSDITDYQAQYAALTAAEQEAVDRAHAGPALDAPARSSSGGSSRSLSAPADDADAAPVAAAGEAAQVAVDTALAQIGDPYVWAAGGPNSFDCSGLTQYAYAAAGVRLPHSSKAQSTMGTAVSRSELQPGDLVFFRSPVSHVGMYIGSGKMVHAATFGVPVQITSVDMAGYAGARRYV